MQRVVVCCYPFSISFTVSPGRSSILAARHALLCGLCFGDWSCMYQYSEWSTKIGPVKGFEWDRLEKPYCEWSWETENLSVLEHHDRGYGTNNLLQIFERKWSLAFRFTLISNMPPTFSSSEHWWIGVCNAATEWWQLFFIDSIIASNNDDHDYCYSNDINDNTNNIVIIIDAWMLYKYFYLSSEFKACQHYSTHLPIVACPHQ